MTPGSRLRLLTPVDEPRQSPLRRQSRSKSGIELEEKLDQRAKEVQELLVLGQATLESEQSSFDVQHPLSPESVCDAQHPEHDGSESPTKRRRRTSESLKLLFEYGDEVSTRLQNIDREYWFKSRESAGQASSLSAINSSCQRYDVPNELLFVEEAMTSGKEKLTLARTTQKLCAGRARKKVSINLGMEQAECKEQNVTADATIPAEPDPTSSLSLLSPSSQSFWPEVSQLRKDMDSLRENLSEVQKQRSRNREKLLELQCDITKLEESRSKLEALCY